MSKLQIPCQKIISGGQTGVDRGALDACLDLNFSCGGWCPKNRKAEDGKIPDTYPLQETPESAYEFRTRQNIIDSDGTLILSDSSPEGGTLLTLQLCQNLNKPFIQITSENLLDQITDWLIKNKIQVLNVAGPRQSEWTNANRHSYRLINQPIRQIRNFDRSR